jgi:prepilin-type N-terminal cleavage/methylation domain-containing protein/prepilin-type processing-associated H-X9-DG protein
MQVNNFSIWMNIKTFCISLAVAKTNNQFVRAKMDIIDFKYKRDEKGFTLVELLVVISIIAILLSILMPALNKVRAQGRRIVCAHNLHTMTMAICTYNVEQGDYPALTWDTSGVNKTYYWTERLIRANVIKGYLDRRSNNYYIDKGQYKAYTCPQYLQMTNSKYIWTSLSYAFNDRYLSPSLGITVADHNPSYLGKSVGKLVIMLVESDHIYMGLDVTFPGALIGVPPMTAKTIPKRHNGGLNSGWVDGHVEFKKFSEYKPTMINPYTRYK